MKKITLLAMLFVAVAFTSCSKDDPAPKDTNGISTGDYYPMAVGNQWNMKSDTIPTVTNSITGTEVIKGTTYYKLSNSAMGSDLGSTLGIDIQYYVAKKGATYISKVGDFSMLQSGISMTMNGYEIAVLKDDLAVGGTWTETIPVTITISMEKETQSVEMTTKYTSTILEKNVAVTVNGVDYKDVIKVSTKIAMTVTDPDTGEEQTNETDQENWYAKGVGPIKVIQISQGQTSVSDLINYVLK